MPEKKIVIESAPIAQPRARITRWGSFDPAKDKKNWQRLQIDSQIDQKLEGPIEIDILYYLPIPKSTSKKKHAAMLANEIKHVKRPDVDNYCKATLDILNDMAFKDDSQIWSISAKKLYSNNPRTEITLHWEE